MRFEPETIDEEIAVGDPPSDGDEVRPHYVNVWNDALIARKVEVIIREQEGSTTVLDDQYEIPADAALPIVLRTPAEYVISLRIVESDTETTLQSDQNWFDCNHTATNVRVTDDGRIDSTFVTTWAECGSTVTGGPDS